MKLGIALAIGLGLLGTLFSAGCGDDDCCSAQTDAALPDVVRPDADPSCRQWHRVVAPLTDAVSLEAMPIHPQRSARLLVDVLQCPGDLPGMPEYGFTLENEFVALRMYGWRTQRDCADADRVVVRRPVTMGFLYPGNWKIVLDDGATRSVTVVAAPAGACNTANQSNCSTDCDCTGNSVCLSAQGFGGPFARCAVPCELDRDCQGSGTCESVADDLSFVCALGQPECDLSTPCPAGFDCQSGTCTPAFTLDSGSRHECTCDGECEAGLHCTFHEGAANGRCEALCLTATSNWCEGAHVCGGGGSVEPALGVCGWVGE